jgi:hypothetical protein
VRVAPGPPRLERVAVWRVLRRVQDPRTVRTTPRQVRSRCGSIMRVIKKHEGERGLKGNGAAVCVGLGSALCQVVQGRCGGPSDLG